MDFFYLYFLTFRSEDNNKIENIIFSSHVLFLYSQWQRSSIYIFIFFVPFSWTARLLLVLFVPMIIVGPNIPILQVFKQSLFTNAIKVECLTVAIYYLHVICPSWSVIRSVNCYLWIDSWERMEGCFTACFPSERNK